ncbi:MAG: FlgD immunoglobulin-like domain containing protein [Candidatus Zixiibacteriota bacterium]
MQKNLRILYLLIALVILAAMTSKGAGVDPGIRDTVAIDSVATYVGSAGIVPVRIYNDEPLTNAEVTLRIGSTDVKIDSFSFAGGRVSTAPFQQFLVSDDSSMIAFIFDVGSDAPMSPGNGILGNLYLSYNHSISPQIVTIDSTTWLIPGDFIEHTTILIDTMGVDFRPEFKAGKLNVRPDPTRPDSIWIAQIQANVGSNAIVDVSLYNASNVHEVSLALTWNSARLTLDSVSYAGTRCESAPTKGLNKSNGNRQLLATMTFDAGSPLTPGTGVAARLYFTIDINAPESTVVIDSTSFLGTQSTYLMLTPADGSIAFAPVFRPGAVFLKLGTDVDDGGAGLPHDFALTQNYPNPFNPTTQIEFSLPKASSVRLDVYNILGNLVRTIVDQPYSAGIHQVTFDGRNSAGTPVASGLYFYRLTAGQFVQTKKMVLLK